MKNSEPEDEQKLCRLGANYNKYTLCNIVPRLIIEARPALPYTTVKRAYKTHIDAYLHI